MSSLTDPVYVFLLMLIVFLLYIIMQEKRNQSVESPTIVQRVIDAPSYYGSRFYGGHQGDIWMHGPGHGRQYWGPHISPGHRYF